MLLLVLYWGADHWAGCLVMMLLLLLLYSVIVGVVLRGRSLGGVSGDDVTGSEPNVLLRRRSNQPTIFSFHHSSLRFFYRFLLAPTGALIVVVCYYWSVAATFSDFLHFCQYIYSFEHFCQ